MLYKDLKKTLYGGEVKRFYVLTNGDEFLKSSALNLFRGLVKEPGFNVTSLSRPTANELRDALSAVPMMSEYRLVIVDCLTDVTGCEDGVPNFGKTILVVTNRNLPEKDEKKKGEKESEREKAVKSFLQRAEVVDCAPTDEDTIMMWISNEAKKYSVTVQKSSARLLITYLQNDMSRISSEFRKLASYKIGGEITDADVRAFVSPSVDYAIWNLSSAVAEGDKAKAFDIYNSLSEENRLPEVLFASLNGHFRKLYYSLCESDDELRDKLKMNDRAIFAVRREARKFGEKRLRDILLTLGEYDERLKNSEVSREIFAETLIASIAVEVSK